LFFWLRVLD